MTEEYRTCLTCNQSKPIGEFYTLKKGRLRRRHCRTCFNAKQLLLRDKQRFATYVRGRRLKLKYDLTEETLLNILNDQQYRCPICEDDLTVVKADIDHDHRTKRVRGVLCHRCNVVLGFAKDDPKILRAAAKFLERSLPST